MMEAEEYLAKLGEKIKKLRLEKGLSQEALAEKLETKHTQIGRVERGEANVTIGMLGKIAKELGVALDALVKLP